MVSVCYETMMADLNIATLTRFGDEPYFVFCDHASNAIPSDLHFLDMPEDMLQTHIAWDIGASAAAAALAKKLSATYFQCGFSRLIIDPNRDLRAPDLIPANSDQIAIPGNQNINEEERRRRINAFHVPYHNRLDRALYEMTQLHAAPFIISVHSFTHRMMGATEDRPWRIGFIWREDELSARLMMDYLRKETGWTIGDNEPYDGKDYNYSVDRHVGPRNLSHIALEIRQDIISDNHGVEMVADCLASGLTAMRDQAER
jgi:predicted N-formylglutamate amidohydrolase